MRVNMDILYGSILYYIIVQHIFQSKELLDLIHRQSDVSSIPDTVHICGSGMFGFSFVWSSESLVILLLHDGMTL